MYTYMYILPEKAANQADSIPPELVEIIDVWPDLPEHIKQTIKTLVDEYQQG